jgi:hypothetical protein
MSEDHIEHWKKLAKQVGIERDMRDAKRAAIAHGLGWDDWTVEEREVYACAFLFPHPAEPLFDGVTINGSVLNLAKYARTALIADRDGNLWRVIEHGKPEKL